MNGPAPDPADITASFVYRWLTDSGIRAQFPAEDHDAEAHTLVADLRAGVTRRDPADPDAIRLIDELTTRSPWFGQLWDRHEVAVRRHEFKRLLHPPPRLDRLQLPCTAQRGHYAAPDLVQPPLLRTPDRPALTAWHTLTSSPVEPDDQAGA
ncbi:MmyB family transcriptional regulator [Actinoplanes friuliensis]|uniref:MmyB family transcriptional regulator n=1 Tax=Actinoplanes friuliensis TaxID=196914 RepID=UPI00130D5A14